MGKKKSKKKIKKKIKNRLIALITITAITVTGLEAGTYYQTLEKQLTPIENHEEEYYDIYDFGFVYKKSTTDYNNNGIEDYKDILNGAKKVAEINPKYISKYYDGGYPPETEGVCTDLVASALIEAGYYIKDMISKDIKNTYNQKVYDISIRDDNIDYRRVENQEIFFKRYIESLSTDIYDVGAFQAGDIITFDNSAHIAIISDKYNKNGVPYVLQNSDEKQTEKEEDVLEITDMEVTGHYRFTYNEKLEHFINN